MDCSYVLYKLFSHLLSYKGVRNGNEIAEFAQTIDHHQDRGVIATVGNPSTKFIEISTHMTEGISTS